MQQARSAAERQDVRDRRSVKNIQVIDGAENCVYDILAATEEEFAQIFPAGEHVAFIDDVVARRVPRPSSAS
jgi:hypothetical protein